MRHKIKNWLTSGTVIFSLGLALGCGTKAAPVTARAMPCPRPLAPLMKPLDPAEAVCSKKNETAKAGNASALRAYIEGLEGALDCFETQTGGEK